MGVFPIMAGGPQAMKTVSESRKYEFLTQDVLNNLLIYDDKTGFLYWKERDNSLLDIFPNMAERNIKSFNKIHAGNEALTANLSGYKHGNVLRQRILAHRAIWIMVHGFNPDCDIDHINMDRSDNRINNLRLAHRSENMWNRGAQVNNKSGLKGAHVSSSVPGVITSSIRVNGVEHRMRGFASPEDAHEWYSNMSTKLHKEYGRVI